MQSLINDYLQTIKRAISEVDPTQLEAVAQVIHRAYEEEKQIFTFGNGASAALASHMACDLGKSTASDLSEGPTVSKAKRLRIQSLNDNTATLTALANDIRYEDIYLEQLKNLLSPGDVVIGISGSGGSPNVLRALEYARNRGAITVGFTGQQGKAVLMKERCDHIVEAPLTMMEQIEDLHVIFHHVITTILKQRILRSPLSEI